ncbi:MAG TPA: hypothetical protein VEW45_00110 [Candidatus Dormibacteraeota bacterium]|nr:hypothetical protein [Candidatus Dormibacteraeota bacterium]
MPTLVALFGMLWVADDWKAALTAAFAVSFFIFLAGVVALAFLDGDPIPLEGGAATIVKDYLALVGLVVTAYFATQAVEKWAASWQAAKEADANARIAEAHASRASLPPERSRPTRRP